MIKALILVFFGVFFSNANSEELLSLKEAVSKTLSQNPKISNLKLSINQKMIDTQLRNEHLSSSLYFNARAQWVEPSSIATNTQSDDHLVSLNYAKKLYDFGLSSSIDKESELDLSQINIKNKLERNKLTLQAIEDFFNIILSDYAFNVQNEAMALAFVNMDKVREKKELKEKTEIDYLESQQEYQQALVKRAEAEQLQRQTRSKLALTMGSTNLPSDVKKITKVNWEVKIPEYEQLLKKALQGNEDLLLLVKSRQLLEQKITTNKQEYGPTLSLEADLKQYSKETQTSNPASVRLLFSYPLYSGNSETLENEKLQIRISSIDNELQIKRDLLKQEVLQLWQQLQLLKLKKEKANVHSEFRDYYLDKSRALYELELESDLGDAMTKYSSATFEQAQVDHQWMLTWETLAFLTNDKTLSILRDEYE